MAAIMTCAECQKTVTPCDHPPGCVFQSAMNNINATVHIGTATESCPCVQSLPDPNSSFSPFRPLGLENRPICVSRSFT
jgi:hypothetical protein